MTDRIGSSLNDELQDIVDRYSWTTVICEMTKLVERERRQSDDPNSELSYVQLFARLSECLEFAAECDGIIELEVSKALRLGREEPLSSGELQALTTKMVHGFQKSATAAGRKSNVDGDPATVAAQIIKESKRGKR
jgi:hypothetical protein